MPGRKLSLLDLFYSTKPDKTDGISNVTNLLSKHDGVTLNLDNKETRAKPQWNYKDVNYSNLMELLDENHNVRIQKMFQTQDPDIITELFTEEMNKVAKKVIEIQKIQKRSIKQSIGIKYWNPRRWKSNTGTRSSTKAKTQSLQNAQELIE